MSDPIYLKLVVVGDGAVGKTCILTTFVKDQFPQQYVPTIFDNSTATIKVSDNIVNLSLWDTAGQQQYNRLRQIAYPNANIFFIVFAVTQKSSLTNAIKKWYPQIHKANPEALKIFVGNKIDMRDDTSAQKYIDNQQMVQKYYGKQKAQELNCSYCQCSALTRKGIKETFEYSVHVYLDKHKPKEKVNKKQVESTSCCQII